MLKRKIRITTVSLLFCVGWAFAATNKPPEKIAQNVDQMLAAVPLPTLSAAEALDIANKYKHSHETSNGSTSVAIHWAESSSSSLASAMDLLCLFKTIRMHTRGLLRI